MASSALPCKLFAQLPIKAGGGELFHELVSNKPHELITASPTKLQACKVHEGTIGTDGCIKFWNFPVDGEKHSAKTVVEKFDMEKKSITYKWLEGEMLELYKHFAVTIHVETKEDGDFVTWTTEYELREPDTPHPLSLVKFHIELTKEIEAHVHA